MFVDRVFVKLVAGKGGNGIVAWRREKCLPKGGPYGGNGGRGGNVVLSANPNYYSLEAYRNRHTLRAKNGMEGGTNLRQGRSGEALTLDVPFGTLVKDAKTGLILHDFTEENPKWIACLGGKGGKGNNFFKTSTNRAPSKCTPGKFGEELEVELELKLIADIGLVGMPNAGKSTLMGGITKAHVKIGAYPFTTLHPNLSYVECEDYSRILVADIPGIIENAHQNKGLGLAFLKHIERTSALVFVLDASGIEERDPYEDFTILRNEMGSYNPELLEKPFIVALNKADCIESKEPIEQFQKRFSERPDQIFVLSAKEKIGLTGFIEALRKLSLAKEIPAEQTTAANHG